MKFPFTLKRATSIFDRFGGLNWTHIAMAVEDWKPGQAGVLTVTKQSQPKSKEQLGYYYAVILPAALDAFKDRGEVSLTLTIGEHKPVEVPLTKSTVDAFLKLRYSEFIGGYKDKGEMSMAECAAFEDFCILWLAHWMDYHVPPADPCWRQK